MVHRRPFHPRLVALLTGAILAIVASSCTTGSTTDDAAGPGTGTPATTAARPAGPTTSTTMPPPPEPFTGSLEDFYRVPAPLPEGAPGTLIRVMDLGNVEGLHAWRVMYHSRDAQDRDRAVTGVVTHPELGAPAGGWPVVSWAHGTTGLTSICAPSRVGAGATLGFGINGVHVATDYIGLGPIGERHAYLSSLSEANSVIDIVRAARQLVPGTSNRWVAAGHSQGGHAALATHERADAHAPELDLLGTVAIAPAAVFDRTFGPDDRIVPHFVGVMALYGIATDHPELKVEDYVSDAGLAKDDVIDRACTNEIVQTLLPVGIDAFYKVNPLTREPARSILQRNDPGKAEQDHPLLLVGGDADTWVVPARVDAIFERVCGAGQVTELVEFPGATHDSVVPAARATITAWFNDRLAGRPAKDSCPGR